MSGFPGLQNYRAVVQAPNFGRNLNRGSGPPLFFELKCTTRPADLHVLHAVRRTASMPSPAT